MLGDVAALWLSAVHGGINSDLSVAINNAPQLILLTSSVQEPFTPRDLFRQHHLPVIVTTAFSVQ